MLNTTYWVVVIALLLSIIELLRRKVLREKYAVVWLGIAFLLILGSNFPERVNHLSRALGFQYLSNFVLFIFMILNLFISMQLSLSVGKAENQVQTLAEEISVLRAKFDQK
jgi:hypothetical protein